MKETQFKVNEEELKEYFPMQHVIKETFNIYQQLLGVTFRQEQSAHTWHPEVQCFSVYDNQYENQIG
jgi:Zn-dependent oligopeptidase